LDVSEKMSLGGATAVRAYPEGEAYVDNGYLASLEGRMLLPNWTSLPGRLQVTVFADSATGYSNTPSVSNDRRTLSGGGAGLHWFSDRSFSVRAHYAHTIGAYRITSVPESQHRFWFSAVKYF
jgi:hemolysin activation/secretion protein